MRCGSIKLTAVIKAIWLSPLVLSRWQFVQGEEMARQIVKKCFALSST